MKLTSIAAAAALMRTAAGAPAYAICPGGSDTPPLCVTGLPTWLGSGGNCERYEVGGLHYAIVYSQTDSDVAAGLRNGMGRGISVSVQTQSPVMSSVCKDGSFYIISSVRNALSN